jgi:hypothetical protein
MEKFSIAYISVLAFQSGFTAHPQPTALDHIGIDIAVVDDTRLFQLPPCQFYAQVKSVRESKLKVKDGKTYYKLRRKNYDSLIKSVPGSTILLLLVVLPDDPRDWLISTEYSTLIQYLCYWLCFGGQSPSTLKHEDSKLDVLFTHENLLTPITFPLLMQKVADGEI